jgi:hypothetical protein
MRLLPRRRLLPALPHPGEQHTRLMMRCDRMASERGRSASELAELFLIWPKWLASWPKPNTVSLVSGGGVMVVGCLGLVGLSRRVISGCLIIFRLVF